MKIFISSTFVDLVEVRKIAHEFLNQFASITEGMEVWGASNENPIDRCLDKVRESDLYIGIIGHRYGSIDEKTKKSITELEYLTAKENGIDRLIFVMSDEYCILPKFVDKGDSAALLSEFKANLYDEHFVAIFNDLRDFSEKLNLTFKNHLVSKGIEISSFNFRTIWDEISDAYAHNNLPDDIKIEWGNTNNPLATINEIEKLVSGIAHFHKVILESYSKMNSDLNRVLDLFEIEENLRSEKLVYGENPFDCRDWEMITFFPNRLLELEKQCFILKLNYLEYKAIFEPWSVELMLDIQKIKEDFKQLVQSAGYID